MASKFISEPIRPVTATFDTGRMAGGEPGLPQEFVWRGKKYSVRDVLRSWKKTGPCRHGSGEQYVRKHWYEVKTEDGTVMKIYFDRQPKGPAGTKRWWLLSVERGQIRPPSPPP